MKRSWPLLSLIVAAGILAASFFPKHRSTDMRLDDVAALPVLEGGRVKPLDTIARVSLLMIHGRQTVHLPQRTLTAFEWLMDVMFRPEEANRENVFRIDNPDVLGAIHMEQRKRPYYSFGELRPEFPTIEKQASEFQNLKSEQRSSYQRDIVNLFNRLILYHKLQNTLLVAQDKNDLEFLAQASAFSPVPEFDEKGKIAWTSMAQSLLNLKPAARPHPAVVAYALMGQAYHDFDPTSFNDALARYREWLLNLSYERSRVQAELLFNRVQPFYFSLVVYLLVAIFIFVSWIKPQIGFERAAHHLILLAYLVHTVGLFARMIIQARPPVTNLYSSAIFVGWMTVGLGLVLERLYKNGIGHLVAACLGFLTLIIAHHLSNSGDTLEMMRAVLDSNFWLATHVVCVTIGYSSTFLSGFLALVYILRKSFQGAPDDKSDVSFEKMVYGVVCFSMFFSFLGTILGGIWADQSWGRFWGWDPKENGALLIVLWNAFILHARWSKTANRTMFMVLAVFGNIVTSFSWFGVNMLGIGLHSYGFMEETFIWLIAFMASQLLVMGLGTWLNFSHKK